MVQRRRRVCEPGLRAGVLPQSPLQLPRRPRKPAGLDQGDRGKRIS